MGKSTSGILFMIIGKAFILGLIGGIIGLFAGHFIAEYFGKEIFRFTAPDIKPLWNVFFYSIVLFPLLWMLASWIPALMAIQIDAAKTLSQE
jgi:ABC-type antimicrobial peptide transport system permease subunit